MGSFGNNKSLLTLLRNVHPCVTSGDKQNMYAFGLSKASKTPKQKDFYKLNTIHKFGAKRTA